MGFLVGLSARARSPCHTRTHACARRTQVEEISAYSYHHRVAVAESAQDPMDKLCQDDPSIDECRVYDN